MAMRQQKTVKKAARQKKAFKKQTHYAIPKREGAVVEFFSAMQAFNADRLLSLTHLWDGFRKEWPLSRVRRMTLDDYSSVGSNNSFTYMVERQSKELGGIGGGSSFKFGVFARKSREKKSSNKTYGYTDQHAWLKRFGETPEEAFGLVRSLVVRVIESAQKGDLDEIDQVPLDFRFKWKIAYLYQNLNEPTIVGIFKREALVIWGELDALPISERHRALLDNKPADLHIHEYSWNLWKYWQTENEVSTVDNEEIESELEDVDESEYENLDIYIEMFTYQYTDEPALEDLLGRKSYATYLAKNIDRLWETNNQHDGSNSFLINLYGAWGAGKTTFANMLMEKLKSDSTREEGTKWRTIEFNAWKEQNNTSTWSWWALMRSMIHGVIKQEPRVEKKILLGVRYYSWLALIKWPYLLVFALLIFIVMLMGFNVDLGDVGTEVKVLSTLLLSLFAIWRIFSPGHADIFKAINRDPANEMKVFFRNFIKESGSPVMVLIDDLDRCKPEFAVNLLEHLHIVFNSPRTFFLVAADRHWVSSSFRLMYKEMGRDERETGRSVGYSFIEKIFQMSIGLPAVSDTVKGKYVDDLLQITGKNIDETAVDKEDIKQAFESVNDDKEIIEKSEELLAQGYDEVEITNVMLERASEKELEGERKHKIQDFLPIISANPRQIKLIVSAYGIYIYLYKDSASSGVNYDYFDQIALWTILSISSPRMAEYLEEHPYLLEVLVGGGYEDNAAIPEDIRKIVSTKVVNKIINGFKVDSDDRQVQLERDFLLRISGY